jgi:hypothetical protein
VRTKRQTDSSDMSVAWSSEWRKRAPRSPHLAATSTGGGDEPRPRRAGCKPTKRASRARAQSKSLERGREQIRIRGCHTPPPLSCTFQASTHSQQESLRISISKDDLVSVVQAHFKHTRNGAEQFIGTFHVNPAHDRAQEAHRNLP